MAIVPRIAAVSNPDTIPFVYGIGHEGNLRAELQLTDPAGCIEHFNQGRADIALVPSSAVPTLHGAELLTGYCVAVEGASERAVLVSNSPAGELRRIFVGADAPALTQLAAFVAARRWKINPEWVLWSDPSRPGAASDAEAYLLTEGRAAEYEGCFACSSDLTAEWYELTGLPFVEWVWVARKGTDYQTTDAFEQALTFGVEHIWEALVENGCADEPTYARLSGDVDYLFDEQKRRALHTLWDSGVKITPRVNPG